MRRRNSRSLWRSHYRNSQSDSSYPHNRIKQLFGKEGLIIIPKYHTLFYEEIDECYEGEGDSAKYID